MTDPTRELSIDLVVLTARLVRAVRRSHTEVPVAALRVLSLIDELGPSTLGGLARADRCAQPTMTGLVKGLVERGWVERHEHPEDARVSLVNLTVAGSERLGQIRSQHADLIAARLHNSGHDTEDLRSTVALLRDLLQEEDPTA